MALGTPEFSYIEQHERVPVGGMPGTSHEPLVSSVLSCSRLGNLPGRAVTPPAWAWNRRETEGGVKPTDGFTFRFKTDGAER